MCFLFFVFVGIFVKKNNTFSMEINISARNLEKFRFLTNPGETYL